MHKLEITGATPEDLFMNAVRMLSVLLKGGAQTTMPAEEINPPVNDTKDLATKSAPEEIIPPKKRGRPSKNAEPAVLNDEMPNDKLPDLTAVSGAAVAKMIEHDPKEVDGKAPVLTLDGDIRPRLRAIQKAHSERGNDMPACVAWIQKLYGPFGIAKADQLKPESFAEFMEASEAYLDGTAEG